MEVKRNNFLAGMALALLLTSLVAQTPTAWANSHDEGGQDCEQHSPATGLISPDDDREAVLDELWEQYLSRALPRRGNAVGRDKLSLQVEVEELAFEVLLSISANGKLKEVKIKDKKVLAQLEQKGIRLVQATEGEQSYWKLVKTDAVHGDEIVLMAFTVEKTSSLKGRVAIYVAAKEGFEKSAYDYKLSGSSPRSLIFSRRQRFRANRPDLFQAPIVQAKKGRLKNSGFKLLFGGIKFFLGKKEGDQKKQNYVESVTLSEFQAAITASGYGGYLSHSELKQLVSETVDRAAKKTQDFTTTTDHMVAAITRESVPLIRKLMLPAIQEYAGDEDPAVVEKMVEESLVPLEDCLERAVQAKNDEESRQCIDRFMIQTPADLGEKLFQLKLAAADMEEQTERASQHYRSCLNERYYSHIVDRQGKIDNRKYRAFERSQDPTSVVKACIYSTAITAIDMVKGDIVSGKPNLVDRTLTMVSSEEDGQSIELPDLSKRDKLQALDTGKQCLQDRGLLQQTSYGNEFAWKKLGRMGADKFERQLYFCIDRSVKKMGESIVTALLDDYLKDMPMRDQARSLIENQTHQGYRRCTDKLLTSERLTGEFDPLYCSNYVIAHALGGVVAELQSPKQAQCLLAIKDQIYNSVEEDLWQDLQLPEGPTREKAYDERAQAQDRQLSQCLQDKKTLTALFRPFIEGPLEQVELRDQQQEQLIQRIVNGVAQKVRGQKGLDSMIDKVTAHKPAMVMQAVEFVLSAEIDNMVQGDDPKQRKREVDKLVQYAHAQLLDHPQRRYRARLRKASASDDSRQLQQVIDELTLDSLRVLSPSIISQLATQMRQDGLLLHQRAEQDFVGKLNQVLKSCLNNKSHQTAGPGPQAQKCIEEVKLQGVLEVIPQTMNRYLGFITSDRKIQQKYGIQLRKHFYHCMNPSRKRQQRSFDHEWENCLISGMEQMAPNALVDIKATSPQLFARTPQADLEFQQCLKQIDHRGKPATGDGDKILWYAGELQRCSLSRGAVKMLQEYGVKRPDAPAVFHQTIQAVQEWLTVGSGTELIFDLPTSKEPSQESKGVLETWQSIEQDIIERFSLVDDFDSAAAQKALQQLRQRVTVEIVDRKGSIPWSALTQLLAQSELTDLFIQATVADEIKREVDSSLSQYGVSKERQLRLYSPQMVRRNLQHSSAGKKAMQRMRQEYVLPLLRGELSQKAAAAPPESARREILQVLARDDGPGGFVETIFYDIVQGKLTEEHDDWTKSKYRVIASAKQWIFNKLSDLQKGDFQWGPPKNLRKTCGGRKAVKAFAHHIIFPMLAQNKQFSDKEIDKISDKFITPHIEQALDNPQIVESYNSCAHERK